VSGPRQNDWPADDGEGSDCLTEGELSGAGSAGAENICADSDGDAGSACRHLRRSRHDRHGEDGGNDESNDKRQDAAGSSARSAAGSSAQSTERHGPTPVYAALDLGTNNCRLLVARPSRRGFRVIDAFSRIIRLGEGLSGAGRLSEKAMQRTIDALNICSRKMQRREVTRSRLIATQACRIASNSDEFIDRVRRHTGLRLEIIDQETEARLAVSGCASLLEDGSSGAMVFDIGGGSSELVWLDLRNHRRHGRGSIRDRLAAQKSIKCWTSLPVGVVTIAEKFGGHDVTPQLFEQMVAHVMRLLEPFEKENRIAAQLENGGAYLLGTSGTVTTLAGIYLGLPYYDRRKVDGCWLNIIDIRDVTRVLVNMSYERRAAQPCIGKERADLVLGGCAILEAMIRTWPCERLRVADRGLREGILATMMAEDNLPAPRTGRHGRQWRY
jgi:exopolyphosphatase/guanosine-5'-triphosphate,3'-diphosphate pyrophosphatase